MLLLFVAFAPLLFALSPPEPVMFLLFITIMTEWLAKKLFQISVEKLHTRLRLLLKSSKKTTKNTRKTRRGILRELKSRELRAMLCVIMQNNRRRHDGTDDWNDDFIFTMSFMSRLTTTRSEARNVLGSHTYQTSETRPTSVEKLFTHSKSCAKSFPLDSMMMD